MVAVREWNGEAHFDPYWDLDVDERVGAIGEVRRQARGASLRTAADMTGWACNSSDGSKRATDMMLRNRNYGNRKSASIFGPISG